ncbi:MAG TPA: hypothetical protein VIO56_03095 [Methylotenera sp.]
MNNKQLQHIKTPLNIHVRGHRDRFCDIDTFDDYTIVSNIGIDAARRIVACVNRCEGVDTETLENSPDLATAFMSAENARLMQVNADLLATLKSIINKAEADYYNTTEQLEVIADFARAAIAKAEAA